MGEVARMLIACLSVKATGTLMASAVNCVVTAADDVPWSFVWFLYAFFRHERVYSISMDAARMAQATAAKTGRKNVRNGGVIG